MSSYIFNLRVDDIPDDNVGSITQRFDTTLTLAAGASDTELVLGGITEPVVGDVGVTVKLGLTGTQAIAAWLFAAASEQDGLSISSVLLSNDDDEAHSVRVMAGE